MVQTAEPGHIPQIDGNTTSFKQIIVFSKCIFWHFGVLCSDIYGNTRLPLFAAQQAWGYFQILGDYQPWLQDVLQQG